MKAIFRTAVVVVSVGLSAAAFAQTKASPSSNPVGRGDNVFFYSPLSGQARSNVLGNPLDQQQAMIGRGAAKGAPQVTPVPEPASGVTPRN